LTGKTPDVAEPLHRIAGVGEDDPVEFRQPPVQPVGQRPAHQAAAVSLQVSVGALVPRTGGEQAQRQPAAGDHDLLGRVGTEGADHRLPGLFLPLAGVGDGISGDLDESGVELEHAAAPRATGLSERDSKTAKKRGSL